MIQLHIGKRQESNTPISSIFRLIGTNEDSLTYAVGWIFKENPDFLIQYLKKTNILASIRGKSYNDEFCNAKIFLQELNFRDKGGRRDIAIETDNTRIVIEAKINGSIPTVKQLAQYTITEKEDGNLDHDYFQKVWGKFKNRFIVTLTHKPVPKDYYNSLSDQLTLTDITIIDSLWIDIIDLVRAYSISNPLVYELYKYLKGDYHMRYFEHEVLCRHVINDERYEMALHEPEGYYFDGSRENFIYPECLFFCPVYGPSHSNVRTGEYLRKILNYDRLSAEQIIAAGGDKADCFINIYLKKYPDENTNTRIHVFTLGKKIKISAHLQKMTGSALYYKEIINLLMTS